MVSPELISGIYLKLENRPGSLEKAAKTLGDRRINIDSIHLETNGNQGFARIYTARPRQAIEALRGNGIESYESQAILVGPVNRPGELARICGELAASKINVEGVTTTAEGKLVLRTSNNDLAQQILRKL
jgi:hypothetical protein